MLEISNAHNLKKVTFLREIVILLLFSSLFCLLLAKNPRYNDWILYNDSLCPDLWVKQYNFDGDDVVDTIYVQNPQVNSGWGRLALALTTVDTFIELPFDLNNVSSLPCIKGAYIDWKDYDCDSATEIALYGRLRYLDDSLNRGEPSHDFSQYYIDFQLNPFKINYYKSQDFQKRKCNHSKNPLKPLRLKNNWQTQYDFDGDSINDTIRYSYSGGAHCCYKITLYLSKSKKTHYFPFALDGGYVMGLDLSKPSNFTIKDFDEDGKPEIFMRISSYNNKNNEIPRKWKKKYGITQNNILIDFNLQGFKIVDFK